MKLRTTLDEGGSDDGSGEASSGLAERKSRSVIDLNGASVNNEEARKFSVPPANLMPTAAGQVLTVRSRAPLSIVKTPVTVWYVRKFCAVAATAILAMCLMMAPPKPGSVIVLIQWL